MDYEKDLRNAKTAKMLLWFFNSAKKWCGDGLGLDFRILQAAVDGALNIREENPDLPPVPSYQDGEAKFKNWCIDAIKIEDGKDALTAKMGKLDKENQAIVLIYQTVEKKRETDPLFPMPTLRKIADTLYRDGTTQTRLSKSAISKRTIALRKEGLIGDPDDNKGPAKRCTPEHINDMGDTSKVKETF